MMKAELFVGIDVSKARLDVALGFTGELSGVNNDAHGVAKLVDQLRKLGPELIALEASAAWKRCWWANWRRRSCR